MVIKLFANNCSKSFYYRIQFFNVEIWDENIHIGLNFIYIIVFYSPETNSYYQKSPQFLSSLGMIWTGLWKILVLLFLKLMYKISKDNI